MIEVLTPMPRAAAAPTGGYGGPTVLRVVQLSGLFLLGTLAYLTGLGFVLPDSVGTPLNPLYMILHVLLLPLVICGFGALLLLIVRDAYPSTGTETLQPKGRVHPLTTLALLSTLLAGLIAIMVQAAQAEVFSCHIIGCSIVTYPLPRPSYLADGTLDPGKFVPGTDSDGDVEHVAGTGAKHSKGSAEKMTPKQELEWQLAQDKLIKSAAPSWGAEATTNTMAAIYFALCLAALPVTLLLTLRQAAVALRHCCPELADSMGLGDGTRERRAAAARIAGGDGDGGGDVIPSPVAKGAVELTQTRNPVALSLIPTSVASGAAVISSDLNNHAPSKGQAQTDGLSPLQRYQRLSSRRRIQRFSAALAGIGLLLPLLAYLTTRLGNSFQWMYPEAIAVWTSVHKISPAIPVLRLSPALELKFFPQMIIYFGTIYVVVIVSLLAHAHPPLLRWLRRPILASSATEPAAARTTSAVRRTATHAFTKSLLTGATHGHALLVALFSLYVVSTFYYILVLWYFQPRAWFCKLFENERWSRALGQTAMSIMGLMLLPVARNSVWTTVFAVPWEQTIAVHRFLAYAFLVSVIAHMLGFWVLMLRLGLFPSALFSSPNTYHAGDFTITPVNAVVIFMLVPAMVLGTRPSIRRKAFEWFYFVHHYVALVTLLMTIWHANFGWYYMLPGLVFWAIDNSLRLLDNCRDVRVSSARCIDVGNEEADSGSVVGNGAAGRLVEICFTLQGAPVQHEMGQYVFVRWHDRADATKESQKVGASASKVAPSSFSRITSNLSVAQSHPFSLVSSPLDKESKILVRVQGSGSWTHALSEHVSAGGVDIPELESNANVKAKNVGGKPVTLSLEGPYGQPLILPGITHPLSANASSRKAAVTVNLLLIAGGSGITPIHSMFRTLLLMRGSDTDRVRIRGTVRLIWSSRERGVFEVLADTWRLTEASSRDGGVAFSAAFHCTGHNYASNADSGAWSSPLAGRMGVAKEVAALKAAWTLGNSDAGALASDDFRPLCVVCGPEELARAVQEQCAAVGVDCRAETFVL